MRGVYTVALNNTTIDGANTLLAIRPPADMALEIIRMWVKQASSVTSAQQRVEFFSQVSAFPTFTSALTPRGHHGGDVASVVVGNTDLSSAGRAAGDASAENGGAKTIILPDTFNILAGWQWVRTKDEEMVLEAGSSNIYGLWLPTTPGDLDNWTAGITFRELG